MPRRVVAVLAVALLSAAACGDSTEPEENQLSSNGAGVEVRATDFAFDPTSIEVEPGAEVEVTLVNAGNVTHSFTAEDVDVDVEAESGAEATATFAAPDEDATIGFVCRFHPSQMTGEIVVGAGGSGAGGGKSEEDTGDYDY